VPPHAQRVHFYRMAGLEQYRRPITTTSAVLVRDLNLDFTPVKNRLVQPARCEKALRRHSKYRAARTVRATNTVLSSVQRNTLTILMNHRPSLPRYLPMTHHKQFRRVSFTFRIESLCPCFGEQNFSRFTVRFHFNGSLDEHSLLPIGHSQISLRNVPAAAKLYLSRASSASRGSSKVTNP
jgi:hypothetical protein